MNITRRRLLIGLSALGGLGTLSLINKNNFGLSAVENEKWLSPCGSTEDTFALAWASPLNNHDKKLTGFRGHGMALNPNDSSMIVMVARRPGNTGLVINPHVNEIRHTFTSPKHLFMEGHACFSLDGQFLFCSESHKETHEGFITVRETQHFTLIKQFKSGGIGPHEIRALPDGKTLAIANGGLIKSNKGKLINGPKMVSNLTLMDMTSGNIKQVSQHPESKASIRHIDISHDGIIAMAMQVQRAFVGHDNLISLTALQKPNGQFIQLAAPNGLIKKLNDYVGSVRINNKYRTVAFTSPKGDLALFWNIDSGDFLGQHFFHNVCGLSTSANEEYFVLSNSAGNIRQVHCQSLVENRAKRQYLPQYQWDNHMLTIQNS